MFGYDEGRVSGVYCLCPNLFCKNVVFFPYIEVDGTTGFAGFVVCLKCGQEACRINNDEAVSVTEWKRRQEAMCEA